MQNMEPTTAPAPDHRGPSLDPEVANVFKEHPKKPASKKKRTRSTLKAGGKIDSIYSSIDCIAVARTLVRSLLSATQSRQPNAAQPDPFAELTCECLNIVANELEKHASNIAS